MQISIRESDCKAIQIPRQNDFLRLFQLIFHPTEELTRLVKIQLLGLIHLVIRHFYFLMQLVALTKSSTTFFIFYGFLGNYHVGQPCSGQILVKKA